MNINAVVSYVNGDDPVWMESFKNAGGILDKSFAAGACRYRDTGTFELCLKSIKKFAPYVEKIFIIVASESQIPDWLDRSQYHIIYHEDFIPKQYLPVFTSCAIETFFGLLPDEVGDRFIYFNDDMILVSPTTEYTFFNKKGMPRIGIQLYDSNKIVKHIDNIRENCYNIVMGGDWKNRECFIQHGPAPYVLNWCKEFYINHEKELLKRLHPVRRHPDDICQYAYMFYQMMFHNIENVEIPGKSFMNNYLKIKILDYKKLIWVCLNDNTVFDIRPYVNILKTQILNL